MSNYDNTNRGSIWKNDKKITDNHPDFTGSLNVEGKEYWVSAWKRKQGAKEGSPALSFSVSEKEQKPQQPVSHSMNAGNPQPDDGFNDDIPF